jgi:hypothetical protein
MTDKEKIEQLEEQLYEARQVLEFYASCLDTKEPSGIVEAVINGGEYVPMGTMAKVLLDRWNKLTD